MSEMFLSIEAKFENRKKAEEKFDDIKIWGKEIYTFLSSRGCAEEYQKDLNENWLVEDVELKGDVILLQLIGPAYGGDFKGILKWLEGQGASNIKGGSYSNMVDYELIPFEFKDGEFQDIELRYTNEELQGRDAVGGTKLHSAAEWGSIKTIRSILKHGMDIDVEDNGGSTPLFMAVNYHQHEAVTFLIENGANIAASNNTGRSLLRIAVERGFKDIVKTLLDSGADKDEIINEDLMENITLFDLALCKWEPEIADLLRERGVKKKTKIKLNLGKEYLKEMMKIYIKEGVSPWNTADKLNKLKIPAPACEKKWTASMVVFASQKFEQIYGTKEFEDLIEE